MTITKEMVLAAEELMTGVQADVFFGKLASLGIVPQTEQEYAALWQLGDTILQEKPRLSDSGRETKQAGLQMFVEGVSPLAHDGCSVDAHKITEELCKSPQIVKAAHLLLAVNNNAG